MTTLDFFISYTEEGPRARPAPTVEIDYSTTRSITFSDMLASSVINIINVIYVIISLK